MMTLCWYFLPVAAHPELCLCPVVKACVSRWGGRLWGGGDCWRGWNCGGGNCAGKSSQYTAYCCEWGNTFLLKDFVQHLGQPKVRQRANQSGNRGNTPIACVIPWYSFTVHVKEALEPAEAEEVDNFFNGPMTQRSPNISLEYWNDSHIIAWCFHFLDAKRKAFFNSRNAEFVAANLNLNGKVWQ